MSFVHRDKKAPRNSLLGPDSYSPNRALEDVTFDECGDGLPFDIQASLLLADVGKRIKLPRREGFGSFKPVLKSPASAELCTLFFWLVFAQRFRPQDREIHTGIYNTLSERFVALFWALNNSAAKDYFLEYYPFAVAEATCLAFGEHFRGSAAHFTDTFHNSLYVEARRVFCGVETTPEAMGHKREQMALVPENDKGGGGEKEDKMGAGGASDIDDWTEEELNEELKKLPGFIERKKARVKRETFDAMNTSPLVRHYITSISDSSGSGRAQGRERLRRTVVNPKAECGGEETFVRTPPRHEQQAQLDKQWVKSRREMRWHIRQNQHMNQREISTLEIAKLTIMSASPKVVGQFVEDLVDSNSSQHKPKPIL